MRTLLGIFLITLTLCGCASESENKAFRTIANQYDCQVSFSKGMTASSTDGAKKYIKLTLGSSTYIDSLPAEETASFSAFTLYQSLSPEEKEKYSHIQAVVEQKNDNSSHKTEFEYSIEKLKTVEVKLDRIRKLQEILEKRNYEEIPKQVDPEAFKEVDTQTFYAQLDTLLNKCGEINKYEFRAFYFFDSELNNKEASLLEVKGTQLRSNSNLNFNVIFSSQLDNNQIYGFNFR